MKKTLIVFVVLFSLSLTLAACGSGAGSASTSINVTLTDFKFAPESFTVPAGQEITITAENKGAVEHEFVIFKLGTSAGDKFGPEDEDNIFWETEVMPGETKSDKFTAPTEPGEYYVTCGIAGHLEAGMSGKLTVVAP